MKRAMLLFTAVIVLCGTNLFPEADSPVFLAQATIENDDHSFLTPYSTGKTQLASSGFASPKDDGWFSELIKLFLGTAVGVIAGGAATSIQGEPAGVDLWATISSLAKSAVRTYRSGYQRYVDTYYHPDYKNVRAWCSVASWGM